MFGAAVLLMTAIGVEVCATALLPKAAGFTQPLWTAVVVAGYALSIWLLAVVVRAIPVSVAYAVWAGLGTAAVAVIGFLFLGPRLLDRLQHQPALLRFGDAAAILAVAAVEQQHGIAASPAQHVQQVMRGALIGLKPRGFLQVLRDEESRNHCCDAPAQPLRSRNL